MTNIMHKYLMMIIMVTYCNAWAQNGHRACASVARALIAAPLLHHIENNILKATLDEISNDSDNIDVPDRRHLHWVNYKVKPSDGAQNISSYLSDNCRIDDRECIVSAVHYICDLHQPLHVIPTVYVNESFSEVRWFEGMNFTLHRVWDELLEQFKISHDSYVNWLIKYHISPRMYVTQVKETSVDKWIDARVYAYEAAHKLNSNLIECHSQNDNERGRYICNLQFVFKAKPTMDSSIASGGVHLAGYLKQSFKKEFDLM
ncbi:hypothetical protein [Trichoplusia ni ascovirus 2c]|uniref:hypothetical protein n=1 Tax=Trichoplusia ni ascovirus 2c TaxID=328615 RepID=UPI0000E4425F|nr:hypothetical protein TNAV2c_gp135 [Trichoplusia ni ascovirus 2c]ABF70652.1 hypothetical protein [Trichoplusia ni ascovirus 2c]AUS94242.1 putative S1/P1 nuclease [Trichoplusia ni ascovirus 6b]